MFENFPYTDMHQLNLDWIVKIAKDFLDQYTQIQQTITDGETTLNELTEHLQDLLNQAYTGYSEDLQQEMADVLTQIAQTVSQQETAFQNAMTIAGQQVIASIPSDYSTVTNSTKAIEGNAKELTLTNVWNFFYGNGYYDANLTWQDSPTITTLKIPLRDYSMAILSSSYDFMLNIAGAVRFTFQLRNGTLTRTVPSNGQYTNATTRTDGKYEACALGFANTDYVYIAVVTANVASITVLSPVQLYTYRNSFRYPMGIYNLTPDETITCQTYFNETAIGLLTGLYAMWRTVMAGDRLESIPLQPPLIYYGAFIAADGSARQRINSPTFTAPTTGLVCIFTTLSESDRPVFIPARRFKLTASDVTGIASGNNFQGLNAVAFGTSLTYRSQTTGGYLNYLPDLSGMTFDNQGIGSAMIDGEILTRVKSYAGYADKDVAILEGFVNDWYYRPSNLGTFTDTTENTVCGCVRSALNHIQQAKPSIKIFLVLDHYGRNYNNVDSSSSARNSANLTQYAYYNEIEKVAESLGVVVIPLYKISEINENTPLYLMDNIHPTAKGAEQTAKTIWAIMKNYYPNVN